MQPERDACGTTSVSFDAAQPPPRMFLRMSWLRHIDDHLGIRLLGIGLLIERGLASRLSVSDAATRNLWDPCFGNRS